MNANIGKNLRKFRLAKDMTQEQLAEVFGVTPQAISRWENDSACPDGTMLPGIAMFFDTTIDELFDMTSLRREEKLFNVHCEINRLIEAGDPAAVALIRENLRTYPGDPGLLMSLSETLAHLPGNEAAEEAAGIAERILKHPDVSMKAKSTTTVNLMYLCLRLGRAERANQLIKSLPHIWESREMLMPEPSEGAAHVAELKKAVDAIAEASFGA